MESDVRGGLGPDLLLLTDDFCFFNSIVSANPLLVVKKQKTNVRIY